MENFERVTLGPDDMKTLNPTGDTVFFTSLGCSKNLVDSQVMLGHMGLGGFPWLRSRVKPQ